MHFSQSFAAKLTAGLLAVTGMIAPAFAVSGTVDAEGGLRLRNASSTDAAVLETIPDGSQIEVSGITESGWYQVSFQDTQGYVSTEYVVLSETVELPTVAEPVYGKVTEGPLNVRSAPSTDSEKVDSFSTGKVLTILETLDGWYKVEEGYVSADYVTIIDAAEAASSGSASEVVDLAMQYLGYPLIGDYLYNPDMTHISRQALHSHRLSFSHPMTGEPMEFTAPLPEDMQRVLKITSSSPASKE